MTYDRDDIFIADIIEDGIQEYLEEFARERAEHRMLAERDASYNFTDLYLMWGSRTGGQKRIRMRRSGN